MLSKKQMAGLSKKRARLICSLTIALALAIPILYFAMEYKENAHRSSAYAQKYALKFQQAIRENPRYWQFNLEKFSEVFADLDRSCNVQAVTVLDLQGKPLYHEAFTPDPLFVMQQESVIHYNNKPYGITRVTLNLAGILQNTALLALLSCCTAAAVLHFLRLSLQLGLQLALANQHLQHLAVTDAKTGLTNGAALRNKLQQMLQTPALRQPAISLAMIGVDRLKKFNLTHSREQGNRVLQELAEFLRLYAPPAATLGRLDGDYFALLFPAIGEEEALQRVERLRQKIAAAVFADFDGLTVSIGVSEAPLAGELTADQLLCQAEKALQWAKETGRNNCKAFSMYRQPQQANAPGLAPVMKQNMNNQILQKFTHELNLYACDVYEPLARNLLTTLAIWEDQTVRHSLRVNQLSLLLGKKIGLSSQELATLNLGTLLHDIGKLTLPDNLLLKKDPLTDEELQLIRFHPQAGYQLVQENGFIDNAAHIILYHHERYDGHGYPFGLTGKDIPLLARICSVVDAFDAMTSDRPYKKNCSFEEAFEEVRRNSGSQFDPAVADAFLQLAPTLISEQAKLPSCQAAIPVV